jgi:hypothetical protein
MRLEFFIDNLGSEAGFYTLAGLVWEISDEVLFRAGRSLGG